MNTNHSKPPNKKSLFTKSCWKYSITYSVRISTMIARNGHLLQPNKCKDGPCLTALLIMCRTRHSHSSMIAVATPPHFEFSWCGPTAEEDPISCNRRGWGLDYLEATATEWWSRASHASADRPSRAHDEQVPHLAGRWSNLRIVWCQAEVFASGGLHGIIDHWFSAQHC